MRVTDNIYLMTIFMQTTTILRMSTIEFGTFENETKLQAFDRHEILTNIV